ncbi:MAG: hypothetical protein Q9195_000839 [Heterodermia aff. obscurata]
MVKPMPSWLNTFNPAASTSKKPAPKPSPKAGSSSKPKQAKKEDQKEDPPAPRRLAAPPPAYETRAPGAMPAGSSRAIAGRGDYNDNGHGYADQDDFEDDFEEDYSNQQGKAIVKRGKQGGYDDEENTHGASRHRHKNDSGNSRDDRKGKEVVRRGKSRRDPSESESDSDQGYKSKKKGKELVRREKDSKKHRKSKKKQESSSDSDSDEQIVEKRQRFEAISFGELSSAYVLDLRRCFEVRVEKIEKWCDAELIRLDTKDGSFNADKLLKSQKVEDDEKKKWPVFEKKYRRWIAENPGGEMHSIPRFRKHVAKGPSMGRSGPSVVVVQRSRNPHHGRPRPPSPHLIHGDPYSGLELHCSECLHFGVFCGDPFHRGGGSWSDGGESY